MVKSRRYKKLRKRGGSKRQKLDEKGRYVITQRSEGEEDLLQPQGVLSRYDDRYPVASTHMKPLSTAELESLTTQELEEELKRIRALLKQHDEKRK